MRNKAINTLGYTGIVTLSQYIGSKKVKIAQIHNTGGNPLFEFLANCLIGDFTLAKATRPTQIMLLKRTVSGEGYEYKRLSGFTFLLTKPEKAYHDTKSVVKYSFIISKDMLESIDDFEGFGIGLYTADASLYDPGNYAAFCEVDLSNKLVNAALVVDWELMISNVADNKINE